MMFIRFVMSRGKEFVVDEIQAREILASPQQLIPISSHIDGVDWTGETINKAHIVCTERDRDAEASFESKRWRLEQENNYLQSLKDVPPERRIELEDKRKKVLEKLNRMKSYLAKNMSLQKM